MALRDGARRVEVYNEGLAVYLHDPAHAAAIVEANPPSLFGHEGLEPSRDKKLKAAAEAGWLVIYTLQQDDPIAVDVLVGPPLSKAEIQAAGVPLMKPQQTVISVPSGTLRIDTANTWELDGETDHEDEPGLLEIPPGDYVLTLHRVDYSAMDDDDDDEAADWPVDTIVLTPAGDLDRPKKIPAILEYGSGYAKIAGLRKWRIADGEFRGLCLGTGLTNLQPRAAAELGLRRGQLLRVEHEGTVHRAVYLAGVDPLTRRELFERLYPDKLDGVRRLDRDLLTAAFFQNESFPVWLLNLGSLRPNVMLTGRHGSPVVITPTDEFALPAPDGGVPPSDYAAGAVTGTVLVADAGGLELGCSAAALSRLARGKAAALELTIAGRAAPVALCPHFETMFRPHHIVATLQRGDDELAGDVRSTMANGGDALFRAMIGARTDELIDLVKQGDAPPEAATIWRAGVGRFAGPDALAAAFRPHWDDPAAGTLTLQPIAWPPRCAFAEATGQAFRLSPLGE